MKWRSATWRLNPTTSGSKTRTNSNIERSVFFQTRTCPKMHSRSFLDMLPQIFCPWLPSLLTSIVILAVCSCSNLLHYDRHRVAAARAKHSKRARCCSIAIGKSPPFLPVPAAFTKRKVEPKITWTCCHSACLLFTLRIRTLNILSFWITVIHTCGLNIWNWL